VSERINEQVKLFANFLNGLALAVMVFGVLRPVLEGDGFFMRSLWLVFLGAVLHFIAQIVVRVFWRPDDT
jgi:hypothetical protein